MHERQVSDVNYFVRFATIILSGIRLPIFFAFFLLIFLVFLLHFSDFLDRPIVDNRLTVEIVLSSRFLSGDAQQNHSARYSGRFTSEGSGSKRPFREWAPKMLVGGSVFYWSDFAALSCVILGYDNLWLRAMASFFLKLSASISMMRA
jgi:hypothetical protein